MAKSITPNMTAEKTVGKRSGEPVTKIRPKKSATPAGPQPRADINGWVLCPGDSVLIIDPPKGEHHGLFAKVDSFPTTLELSSYVQIDGRPSGSGRVLMPNAMLRWMGPDEAHIDHHRPTRPGERVRVVLDNEALATPEMKALEGKLGTVTELMPTVAGNSMVTVKLDDPAELPTAINSFDLLVVPIPVVHYVPEPDEAPVASEEIAITMPAWDLLYHAVASDGLTKEEAEAAGAEVQELFGKGLLYYVAGDGANYRVTAAGRDLAADDQPALPVAQPSTLVATEPAAEFRNIPLEQIAVTRNTRQVFDETALAELAQSIRERGVIAPVVVRRYDVKGPYAYELVAGERRLRASKLAGLATIPAMIRVLDDRAFIEVQLLENLQRQDVRPSDEAQAFAELLNKHGFSPEEISLKVGKPVKFVLQRAKLVTLIPFWMQALEQDRLPLAAAHELARLPEAGQGRLEEAAMSNYDMKRPDAVFTAQWVRGGISQWVLADLNAAFFRKNDATLYPKAGACTACPKRSGACQGLFDEVEQKHDYCLDKPCFEQKKANLVERHKEELRKQTGKKAVLISSCYYNAPAGALDCYKYKDAKQEDAGAVQALMVDGTEMGRIKWVVVKQNTSQDKTEQEKKDDAARLRKERITKSHRLLIAGKLDDDIADNPTGRHAQAALTYLLMEKLGSMAKANMAFVHDAYGWPEPTEAERETGWDKRDADGLRPYDHWLLAQLAPLAFDEQLCLYLRLEARHKMDYEYESRQFRMAHLVGQDYDFLKEEAVQAVEQRYYTKKAKGAKA